MEIRLESSENQKIFGNIDSTVEYCRARPQENFSVYVSGASGEVIERTKRELANLLSNVRV